MILHSIKFMTSFEKIYFVFSIVIFLKLQVTFKSELSKESKGVVHILTDRN
jgi:hypothetical protein